MELLARVVGIWMVFVIYIAVGVKGVALEASCTVGGTACTDLNAECRDDGSGLKCLCKTTFYKKTDVTCGAEVALNALCEASQPAGQCADALAECKDVDGLKCLCQNNNYVKADGSCGGQIALDATCFTGQPADQCLDSLAECRDDSGLKCKCKAANFDNSGTCAARKNPDDTGCVDGGCVTHATCDTVASPTICECDAGYTASPTTTPTMCSGVVKFASLSYMYVVPILVSLMFLVR